MILDRNNSCIIIEKITKKQLFRIAYAVKQLFQKFLYKPKIIFNTCSNFLALAQILNLNAKVKVVKDFSLGIFSYITHFNEFDLGIYCYESNDKKIIKFYSGSGYVLSDTMFSILEKYIIGNFKKDYETDYQLTQKKLLNFKKIIKIIDFNELIKNENSSQFKTYVKPYINFYKSILGNNCKIRRVCGQFTSGENYLFSKIFRINEIADISVFASKKHTYFYNNDEFLEISSLVLKKDTLELNQFNEYKMFKECYEKQKKVVKFNNQWLVTDNCFTFDVISHIIYFSNLLKYIF